MNIDLATAVLLLVGVVGFEVVKLTIGSVFRKFVNPNFVTTSDCTRCGTGKDEVIKSINNEIVDIKGILIVMASKVGVDEEDMKKLVRRG